MDLDTPFPTEVRSVLHGKVVLVTGGTGSFGRAFCAEALRHGVAKLIVLSRDELKQFEMTREAPYTDPRMRFFIGDVRDRDRLYRAFDGVDIVIHAAALKQIDACSYSPAEAIKTNIVGTMNVVDAAIDCDVDRVLAISTDKACEATTLYGKTKGCVEGLIAAAGAYSGKHSTRFAAVRYGNVWRSRGSVVPYFEKLLSERRPLTITHPKMTRFHLRIERAVEFVLLALSTMQGGEVFVPRLPSFSVLDLVEAMGAPTVDIIGLRPQEKVAEVMIGSEEAAMVRDCGTHFIIDGVRPFHAMAPGFRYDSATNANFLSVEELRAELAR